MTKRTTRAKKPAALAPAEQRSADAIDAAVARLLDVATALLDDSVGGEDMNDAADAFFAACAAIFDPDAEPADLSLLLEHGGHPTAVLSAFHAERALLGHPVMVPTSDGGVLAIIPDDLENIGGVLDEVSRLDPHARAERYIADPDMAALAVGLHLARDGANEIFPLEIWSPVTLRRCLAATAVTAATLAAAALSVVEESEESEDEHVHAHRHEDLDGLVHTAAAAVDALEHEEREDLIGGGFGTVSFLVEDILYAATNDLDTEVIHFLSARVVAAFLRGFAGAAPVEDIVHSDEEDVVRILAGADLAGRLAAERLAPEAEPESPFQPPRPLIH